MLFGFQLLAKMDSEMQNGKKQGIHILILKRIDKYALRPVSWFMGEHKLETFLKYARCVAICN